MGQASNFLLTTGTNWPRIHLYLLKTHIRVQNLLLDLVSARDSQSSSRWRKFAPNEFCRQLLRLDGKTSRSFGKELIVTIEFNTCLEP